MVGLPVANLSPEAEREARRQEALQQEKLRERNRRKAREARELQKRIRIEENLRRVREEQIRALQNSRKRDKNIINEVCDVCVSALNHATSVSWVAE